MKKFYLIFIILCGLFLSVNFSYALTYVDGYYRSDGTYVNPYYRHSADDIRIPGDNIRTIIIIKPAEKSELEKIQEQKNKLDKELQDAIRATEDRAFQLRQNEYYFSVPCVFPIMPSVSGCFREEHYDREYVLAKRSGFPPFLQNLLDECRKSIDDYNKAIDDYNKDKQAYDQCFDNYIEQRINEIAEKKIQDDNQNSNSASFTISAAEIDPYLSGVVRISCKGGYGSGSLWNVEGQGYKVLTNFHIIEGENGTCDIDITRNNDNSYGVYEALLYQQYGWNDEVDAVAIGFQINKEVNDIIVRDTSLVNGSMPVSNLNYKVSTLRKCPMIMPLGSPVAIIGFPAFAEQVDYYEGRRVVWHFRTVTNGIISAHSRSLDIMQAGLPGLNYLVSNKIDSGNSGGIALSKDKNGLCVLGIPTWLSVGNYETQGIVQNIHNVMYTK